MKTKRLWVAVAACLWAFGAHAANEDLSTLNGIQNIEAAPGSQGDQAVAVMRQDMLTSLASSMGARAGLAHRSAEIMKILDGQANSLDRIYNFRTLMLSQPIEGKGTTDYMILPPVIAKASKAYQVESDNLLNLSDASYEILAPARFVTAPPSWRDYLLMQGYTKPETPNSGILPKSDEERAVWKKAAADGWAEGIKQANAIFSDSLARLKRDHAGILTYRELLAQRKVTAPYVVQADLGVTGDANSVDINHRRLMITAASRLELDSKKWNAIPVPRPATQAPVPAVKDLKSFSFETNANGVIVTSVEAGNDEPKKAVKPAVRNSSLDDLERLK